MKEHDLFRLHRVRCTPVRRQVVRILQTFEYAPSLADLSDALPDVDRSTLFRTLTLFEDYGIIHAIDDGSGQRKYCLCQSVEEEEEPKQQEEQTYNQHVHIFCTKCRRTFCLRTAHIPPAHLPKNFLVTDVSYVVRGICGKCRRSVDKLMEQ